MPFIWRNKSSADTPALPPEALSCLDAAYISIDMESKTETVSPQVAALLGLSAPMITPVTLLQTLKPESAARLQQVLQALKSGQVTAPVVLATQDGNKALLAKPSIAGKRTAIIWLYDITSEYRQQQRMQAENEKLKSEVKHYSTLLNMAPFPIWQRDSDLNIRYYNLAYSEIAEDTGDKGEDDGAPELDRRARAIAAQARDSAEPKTERRHVIVDGARKYYEIAELPVPQEGMLVGFAHDIGEIEHLQDELSRHLAAQGDLLESSASAMAIYGKDMRLKSFNYAFESLWKLDEAWLDTQPTYGEVLEALREKRKLPEQANFVQFKQQQLKLFTDLIEPREEFFYLPDGKALRVIAIPHALGGILFAYEDVTDRLALERSYNTLIAVQRETLDNLHEGVAVFGEDGRLKLFNPVFLQMWNIDEATARAEPHIGDLIDRSKPLYQFEDWAGFREQRIAQVHGRSYQQRRLERTDGKVIDCSTVPLPDGATLITYIDVTDSTVVERSLRERNEALQEADRLKSEFLANVSYELRSPLTSISGFSEMLNQEYFGTLSEKQKEYVDGIHQSSQHLMQLINDILDLASIEAGYMQLEVSQFDIRAMLKSVVALIQERAKEYALHVAFECPPKIGKMLADETRLKQLLFKLLSNAIKFAPLDSTITLGVEEMENGTLAIYVADEGPGILEAEHEKVFDKFYKAQNPDIPKSRSKAGTGLGLSIVKSFVELHGGAVSLASSPGKGTRITCIFPRENPELLQFVQAKPTKRKKQA